MDPGVLAPLIPITAIVAWGVVKVAKIKAQGGSLDVPDAGGRLDALEHEVGSLRHELNETQERLDFAERLLAQPPETRRVEPNR